MKKLAFLFIAMAGMFLASETCSAQGGTGMSDNKVWVRFKYPKGNTTERSYMFPTFETQAKTYDNDTTVVNVQLLETWVTMGSIAGASLIIINPSDYVLPGAKVWLQLGNDGSNRTVYIKQGSYALDTVSVGNTNVKRQYVFNGTKFEVVK